MHLKLRPLILPLAALALLTSCSTPSTPDAPAPPQALRFATFNTSLAALGTADQPAYLATADPGSPLAEKARAVATVLREVRPDVVLLSEFDDAGDGSSITALASLLAEEDPNGRPPLRYADAWAPEVNTGVPSGLDLNADGEVGGPGDAWGWGLYPGQFGLLLLSRFPIDTEAAEDFRHLRWSQIPGHSMPEKFYPPGVAEQVRLSSKTHALVPVRVPASRGGDRRIDVLISHPTPPVFDGPEDRNGRRNRDEIRFWTLLLEARADRGDTTPAVLLGDLNADPHDGDGHRDAIRGLLSAPGVRPAPSPASPGGPAAATRNGGVNEHQRGPAAHDTADFADHPPHGPGNLRVDYALPVNLDSVAAGVFWPTTGPAAAATTTASDHRLVWVDVAVE